MTHDLTAFSVPKRNKKYGGVKEEKTVKEEEKTVVSYVDVSTTARERSLK